MTSLSVLDRVAFKRKNEIKRLDLDERLALIDGIIEKVSADCACLSDEELIQLALDRGVIL